MPRSPRAASSHQVAPVVVSTPLSGVKLAEAARELLEQVSARTRPMIDARFGLTGGTPRTLAEIGTQEGISRERVRQIIEAGFDVLRREDTQTSKSVLFVRTALHDLFQAGGGVALEEHFLASIGAGTESDRSALRLLLSTFPEFQEARDTQRTHAHWVLVSEPSTTPPALKRTESPTLETVLETAERLLENAGTVIPEDQFLGRLSEVAGTSTVSVLQSFLAVSKRIVRTPFGGYGLAEWREAAPRSVGDKACMVLRAYGKPLHFRAVAEEINRARFDRKRALPETVHNDLIRDPRFVLVGRGLYALREWGFTPGRVSDVLVQILQSAGHPLTKADLVTAVLQQRFVKRNTILLSLLNRDLFRELPDGTYVLAGSSAAAAASAAPGGSAVASGKRETPAEQSSGPPG